MTPQEIIKEIKHFSLSDKVSVIEQVSQSLLTDLKVANKHLQIDSERQLSIEERTAIVESLYGFAATEGRRTLTDEEIREDRANYLLEKYS